MDGGIPMWAISRRPASAEPQALDLYDIAYLVGGRRWVIQTVLIALQERDAITLRRSRIRTTAGETAEHPVERALIELCPRLKPVDQVVTALLRGPELEEIRHRLAARGLLTRLRGRPTRTGRRRVEAAVREGALPAYVFYGPLVVPEPARRKAVSAAIPIPTGDPAYWDRNLLLAYDPVYPDHESFYEAHAWGDDHGGHHGGSHGGDHGGDHGGGHGGDHGGGHHSCGGGGGGGGSGD
ncbi:TIGR04222 domain-containing membrane protein [Streptomyces malaysiensis]|uniref:TIGR04222 domain-containing membrane protein n=1 Tax=Streptomyces malaysiensis TaxID=92644 RepID=UPI002B2E3479|nr:TIGR04222 domain-containing membrane protein [Streptomyces malaysiensis]